MKTTAREKKAKSEDAVEVKHASRKTIYRSSTNKVIAGVCGGLGEYFDIDPLILRIIFVFLFLYGGSGLLIYFVLWLILPKKKGGEMKDNVEEMKTTANELAGKIRETGSDRAQNIFGGILVAIGVLLVLDNMGFDIFSWVWQLWPLLIVFLGISLIGKK